MALGIVRAPTLAISRLGVRAHRLPRVVLLMLATTVLGDGARAMAARYSLALPRVALLALAIGAVGGEQVCEPDVEAFDAAPFRLEKKHDEFRADASAISGATDAASFAQECEAVLSRRYAARARCETAAECGGEGAGTCSEEGRCNCNAGRAGERCEVDTVGLCQLENFWTALGGEGSDGLRCAGSATRTFCSASNREGCVGTQTCSITDRTCLCPPDECWDPNARRCAPNTLEVSARAWARNPPGERADAELLKRTADWGIAFSGGGTRAMVSTFGVLRGLDAAGLLGSARYIGANSGSSWAAAIFGYASAHLTDAQLLGPYVPPEALSNASLYHIDEAQGAAAARRPFGALLLTLANNQRVRLRDLWSLAVSKAFFEPYGFGKLFRRARRDACTRAAPFRSASRSAALPAATSLPRALTRPSARRRCRGLPPPPSACA